MTMGLMNYFNSRFLFLFFFVKSHEFVGNFLHFKKLFGTKIKSHHVGFSVKKKLKKLFKASILIT